MNQNLLIVGAGTYGVVASEIAAYDGQEDSIRDLVADVVPTYHPAGEHGSEDKGEAYTQQMKMVMQKREEKVVAFQ